MTECDEVAETMVPGFLEGLRATDASPSMDAAREYVRKQMPDEGMTLRDNVAYSLYHDARRALGTTTQAAR